MDVILYWRAVGAERRCRARGETAVTERAVGIISIKAQNEDYETPMQPITMMRNALGRGGRFGVPLERKSTTASSTGAHAPIVASEDGASGD